MLEIYLFVHCLRFRTDQDPCQDTAEMRQIDMLQPAGTDFGLEFCPAVAIKMAIPPQMLQLLRQQLY
jgi:hypothetical protein